LANGDYGSCALAANGSWKCWGQLGSNIGESGLGPVVALAAGFDAGCQLDSNGEASCTGTTVPPGKYSSIDAGSDLACGITTSGLVACGSLDPYRSSEPMSGRFMHIAAADYGGVCGLRPNGDVVCFGALAPADYGGFVSISSGVRSPCGIKRDGNATCWSQEFLPGNNYLSVVTGESHAVGILATGELVAWGDSDAGRAVPPPGKYLSVSAGYYNSCAVRSDGRVLCWVGLYPHRLEPPDDLFKAVSVGIGIDDQYKIHEYACGVRLDGTLRCWGGGLGAVPAPEGVFTSVATKDNYACALSPAGKPTCWGEKVPPLPSPDLVLTELTLSNDYTCGLTDDGRITCQGAYNLSLQ
jgi:hypothetical protein